MSKVIVCGSRNFQDSGLMDLTLDAFHENFHFTELIHGGASGADTLAGVWAGVKNVPVKVFVADWKKFGKSAGPIRNQQMAGYGVRFCIAFWDGKSRGTKNMIDIAQEKGIYTIIVNINAQGAVDSITHIQTKKVL